MKEQWIQQMQQKLAGYRQPAPEVSWDEIEKALVNNRQKAKARMVQLWTRRIAAAVVVLVAVTTGYLAWNQQEETITANNVETEVRHEKENPQPKEEKIVAKESVSHKSKILSVSHKPQVLPTDTLPSEPLPEPEVLQQEEELSVQLAEESSAPHDEDSHTQIANTSPMPLPLDYPTDVRKPAVSGNRLMAKVYLTNGAMKETEHNIPTEIIHTYNYVIVGPDGKPLDVPTRSLSDYASGAGKNDVYHNLPVRYGLSLRYRLNNRWSLESGLVYTRLCSDIHTALPTDLKPDVTVTSNIEQTLSYIGIPANVSYQLWGSHYGSFYVTAGGMAEKMVKGRLHIEESEDKLETTESVSIRPLQFSVNGAIGAEFNLSRWFSIYAEPGVGYYFDNGSSLPTYYRDKPFGFNLNVGLKINIK
jgi:hypothetical protein